MKKLNLLVIVLTLSMSGTMAFAAEKTADIEILAVPMSENKVMEEEIVKMNDRLAEIRDIDKSELSAKDKKELKKELKNMKKKGGAIYIGGTALLLLLILIVLLV